MKTLVIKTFLCTGEQGQKMKTIIMKKVTLMCLGILFTATMYPHGSCQNKTNSNGGEKLKAYARANDLAFVNAQWVNSNWAGADITANASKACAWQSSRNNAGAHSFNGQVKKNRCGRGYSKSYLANQLLDLFSDDPEGEDDEILEQCSLGMNGQLINGNIVTILGVYGYMEAVPSMISSYSIKIWLPDDLGDTLPEDDEMLYNGTIRIIDGNVVLEGSFNGGGLPANFYNTSMEGDYRRVTFNSQDLSIPVNLPAGRSMNDIVVITEADGTGNEAYFERVATNITENEINAGQITFGVFPNPTSDNLSIQFSGKQPENISVEVIDSKGQLVKKLYQGKNETSLTLNFSTANLPAGVYQVVISSQKNIYIRKFLKD